MDLIKRTDAIDALNECEDIKGFAYRQMHDALMEIPSVEPKQGEWVAKTENYHSHWVCSICGGWALLEYNEQMCLSNFCPNCGARMKGADDE